MLLSRVDLPDPLGPKSPNTVPRGRVRLTPFKASAPGYRFTRSRTSRTGRPSPSAGAPRPSASGSVANGLRSSTGSSSSPVARQGLIDQRSNLAPIEAESPHLLQELLKRFLSHLSPQGADQFGVLCHKGPLSPDRFGHVEQFHLPIGPLNGVGIHSGLHGQIPLGREPIAWAQLTPGNGPPHLIHNLQVDGAGRGEVEARSESTAAHGLPPPSPTALGLEPGHLSPRAHMVWCTSIIVHSIHPVKGPPERR